jgi:D-serine deaminase-like pyridoxal phosphate-dependent protein
MMFDLGVCAVEDIAVAVACPVVALHPQRHEAVIYGGAIHFSKEALISNGLATYGYAAFPSEHGWQFTSRENCVISSTQEHGVLRLRPSDFDRLQVGGLVDILPVHSCLTVAALKNYLTLNGEVISTLNSCSDYILRDRDRHRYEGQDEDEQRQIADPFAPGIQLGDLVERLCVDASQKDQ